MIYSHALWRGCISALIVYLACVGLKELQSPEENDLTGAEICASQWALASPNVVSLDHTKKISDGDISTIKQPLPAVATPRVPPMVKPTPVTKKTYTSKVLRNYGLERKNADNIDSCLGGERGFDIPKTNGPKNLSNKQIQAVMLKGNFSFCDAMGTGTAQIKITISSSGSVANTAGDGTPLGDCIAGWSRGLTFPSISWSHQTFSLLVAVSE